MSEPFDHDAAAAALEASRRNVTPLPPFTDTWPDLDAAAAYDVAARYAALRTAAAGSTIIGRKVGFTNRAAWPILGVDRPMWGRMFSDTVALTDGPSARAEVSGFQEPRLEPEIVFRLATSVHRGASVAEVAAAVEWVAFGYELVQSPFPGWKCKMPDGVMAGGLHASSLVGPRHEPWPTMIDDLASFSLRLLRDGEVIGEGRGADVLDSPLNSIVALLEVTDHDTLRAGEIITTGTVTTAAPVRPGETYSVEITGLPLAPLTLHIA